MKTALRDRSRQSMYAPGKVAGLIADLALGIALILVGLFVLIFGGLLGMLVL